MNSVALETPAPNTHRWVGLLVIIFIVQLALIYFLSARHHKEALPSPAVVPLQIFPGSLTEQQFSEAFLVSDPALFASANIHGFSGPAWLKDPPRAYEQNDFVERSEPPFWLALNLNQFGTSISQFIQTNSISSEKELKKVAPKIEIASSFDHVLERKTNSQFSVEADLASRPLLNPPQLQAWAHTNLLSNSVAQIAVDKHGLVLSARLLSRSGFANADSEALELARHLQFSPDLKNEITLGNAIFDWQTVPLIETNRDAQSLQP